MDFQQHQAEQTLQKVTTAHSTFRLSRDLVEVDQITRGCVLAKTTLYT